MSLSIEHLSAGYGNNTVLADISVSGLAPGAFVGLIGPNASGKSTLFKTLAGLLRCRSGVIRIKGEDIGALPLQQRARRIAYMPQAFGCNAVLTVFESVLLALKQTSGWRVQADNLDQVSQTLSRLRLSHLADRGIADLSGGQAQMVAVAQTLVRRPDVILLDEPTSALDLHHQLSVMTSLRDEARERQPIVLAALHDLNLAAKFCDRLILLCEGRILADGTPENVLALPEIGRTYRVETDLERSRRGTLFVDARLPAAGSGVG